eukprot:TRINITY_DN7_c1_g2_i1.p1 TRINITY_DN7_c1_g2~~TRINITY_DN7_c1_g2_i1.p1  ORF type:complete len:454 (-),score=80.50 TRINITY_DN7_c1_g2_i1:167-1456(-)
MSTPLTPVYQLLHQQDAQDDTMIPLESVHDYSQSASVSATPATVAPKKGCCSGKKQGSCSKKSSSSRLGRCCGCLGKLFVLAFILMAIGSLISFAVMSVKVHRCLNPAHSRRTEYIFEDSEVTGFDLSAVSGDVSVHTCDRAEKLTLRVTTAAHSTDLLNTMNSKSQILAGIFHHSVDSPSFDFKHCQLTHYHLTVPTRLAAKLKLNAHVLAGKISLHTENYEFESLDLNVEFGAVVARDVTTSGLFKANAQVGAVSTRDVTATDVLLYTHTGFIHSRHTVAEAGLAHSVYGGMTLNHWQVAKVRAENEMGVINLRNVPQTESLEAIMKYGRLNFQPRGDWYGSFEVTSPFGFVSNESAKSARPHVLEIDNEAHIKGYVAPGEQQDDVIPTEGAEVTLSSVWGSVAVFRGSALYQHHQKQSHHKKHPRH